MMKQKSPSFSDTARPGAKPPLISRASVCQISRLRDRDKSPSLGYSNRLRWPSRSECRRPKDEYVRVHGLDLGLARLQSSPCHERSSSNYTSRVYWGWL